MDASYDRLGLPFESALACRATVVSRNGTRAVVDAGLKALSAEYGVPRALDASIEEVVGLADEHTTLRLAPDSSLQVGDAVLLIPAHVDPTVNLHAALHAVEDDGTVHRWPVDARRP
jgi:D-serine deaminase-like pyridoxal phosphate-dependent protein